MFKRIKAILSSLASGKACKKTRIQSIVCLLVASASVTLSSLSAFALYQSNASTGTPVDVEGLRKSNLVAKDTKSQNVVEKDGLQFETLIPEAVIKIPENKPGARTSIKFGCRITNKTQSPIRVAGFQVLEPQTKTLPLASNRTSVIGWGGRSEPILPNPDFPQSLDYPFQKVSSKETFPLLMPGKSTTFFLSGYLFRDENNLIIQLSNFNFYWVLSRFKSNLGRVSLDAGEYYFWFKYENQEKKVRNPIVLSNEGKLPDEPLWTGFVETPVVKFNLANHN